MKKIDAERAGVAAFATGRGRAPASNSEFTRAVFTEEDTQLIDCLTGYLHGWDVANLADGAPAGMPSVAELHRITGEST